MVSVGSGHGWWQAANGQWYPPEEHPLRRQLTTPTTRSARTWNTFRIVNCALLAGILAGGVALGMILATPTDPFSGKSPSQVLAIALNSTNAQNSVHTVGTFTAPTGGSATTVVDDTRYGGRQTVSGTGGNAQILLVSGNAYLQADDGFLEHSLGLTASIATPFAGEWVVFHDGQSGYAQVADDVSLSTALVGISPVGRLSMTGRTTIDGQNVVGISGEYQSEGESGGVRGS